MIFYFWKLEGRMPYNMAASCVWCGCESRPYWCWRSPYTEAGLNHVSWMCCNSLDIDSGAAEACSAQISLQCRFSGWCTMRSGLIPCVVRVYTSNPRNWVTSMAPTISRLLISQLWATWVEVVQAELLHSINEALALHGLCLEVQHIHMD